VGLREPTTVIALKALKKAAYPPLQSPEDRRKLHVYLTPKARQLEAGAVAFIIEVNDIATNGLSPAEVEALRDLLRKVGAEPVRRRGRRPPPGQFGLGRAQPTSFDARPRIADPRLVRGESHFHFACEACFA
jgi:hypothetical protein